MRAIWVDEGNDPAYDKLRAHGIDAIYLAMRDPRVTLAYLEGVRAQGFRVGVYFAQDWYTYQSGALLADRISHDLTTIAPAGGPDFPCVCADIETHDVGFILAFLKRWREHRQKRVTDWALEGFQGGLFSPTDVIHIAAANVGVIASTYTGSMQPLAADRVALDLVTHSFPPAMLYGFYDAAVLPLEWSGYAFTQGRLP